MKIKQIKSILEKAEIPYDTLPIGAGREILVMERGGRIYGPFNGDSDSFFWMPAIWEDEEGILAALSSDEWNTGGDRIAIAPEIQFSVGDRMRFWDTLDHPLSIDPGNYKLSRENGNITLEQELNLKARILAEGNIHLRIKRSIHAAENPFAQVGYTEKDVAFYGYTQTLLLEVEGDSGIAAACWNLAQVKPRGNIYIPMTKPFHATNYFEDIGSLESFTPDGVVCKSTGCNRYKVGYPAVYLTGRFGFTSRMSGESCIMIRNYPNDPSNFYNEEPPLQPGKNGFSFHIYNDDGNSGGFSELECNTLSVQAGSGEKVAVDRVSTWFFSGPEDKISSIGQDLLGFRDINIETAT